VRYIRSKTGRTRVPVHVIGGLADDLGRREALAVARAASDEHALGSSFYKFSLSGPEDWSALRRTWR
jgi:hypothetical protein